MYGYLPIGYWRLRGNAVKVPHAGAKNLQQLMPMNTVGNFYTLYHIQDIVL